MGRLSAFTPRLEGLSVTKKVRYPPSFAVVRACATGPNLPFVTSTADDGPQPELDIR
jgi:hypothetical protein